MASDLHGNNNLLGIIDGEGKRIYKKKLPNDPLLINDILNPFQEEIVGIVVESTYNWYWWVDALMEEGDKVHQKAGGDVGRQMEGAGNKC